MSRAVTGMWSSRRSCSTAAGRSPICRHCDGETVEDHEHMWFSCPAHADIRARFPKVMEINRTHWPPCLKFCGILPKGMRNLCNVKHLKMLQTMFVRICLHRNELNRQRNADATDGARREYPWEWEPTTECCHNDLETKWPSVEAGWSRGWSHTFFVALYTWLNQLRWDVAGVGGDQV